MPFSVKLKFLSKKTDFLKDFEVYQFINGYIRECLFHMRQFSCSTFSQHSLMHFSITRGLRPLVIWGNASTCAEKKLNPRIASCGKDTLSSIKVNLLSHSQLNSNTVKRSLTLHRPPVPQRRRPGPNEKLLFTSQVINIMTSLISLLGKTQHLDF